ncbi:Non-specific lipid-transfer protein 3 [Abeliophyllum distichum]|uniref:Non-specific lipid-transfer protein n=1 Tax=Abeliophyllum distichum TaxID=126358 RepID=A0ABD1R961_9LAMI
MVVVAPYTEAAISCRQVQGRLAPCMNYLLKGGAPSFPCCGGVKTLYAAAKTTADRKTACICLKQLVRAIKRLNLSYAAALPAKCSVSIPYKISPSTDCSMYASLLYFVFAYA